VFAKPPLNREHGPHRENDVVHSNAQQSWEAGKMYELTLLTTGVAIMSIAEMLIEYHALHQTSGFI
jgi:hypothetical protein